MSPMASGPLQCIHRGNVCERWDGQLSPPEWRRCPFSRGRATDRCRQLTDCRWRARASDPCRIAAGSPPRASPPPGHRARQAAAELGYRQRPAPDCSGRHWTPLSDCWLGASGSLVDPPAPRGALTRLHRCYQVRAPLFRFTTAGLLADVDGVVPIAASGADAVCGRGRGRGRDGGGVAGGSGGKGECRDECGQACAHDRSFCGERMGGAPSLAAAWHRGGREAGRPPRARCATVADIRRSVVPAGRTPARFAADLMS